MRTPKRLYPQVSKLYTCELENCPKCGGILRLCDYYSGRKTVQTLTIVMGIAYRPKHCVNPRCDDYEKGIRSAEWTHIAPLHCTYGYDVITRIGWQRQTQCQRFVDVYTDLTRRLEISESQVRYLYYHQYQPLLACYERKHWAQLQQVSKQSGLLLSLDGLAPEGGEPQLWVVRELRTNLTLRSGWMSRQDKTAFEHFLEPITELGLRVEAILSDKQKGLLPAVKTVFSEVKHAFCHSHYLNNIAEPIAKADQEMKVTLRKAVRQAVGDLIRAEQIENKGVLTVTGMIPTPAADVRDAGTESNDEQTHETAQSKEVEQGPEQVDAVCSPPSKVDVCEPQTGANSVKPSNNEQPTKPQTIQTDPVEEDREEIVTAIQRRVRYLLTLKGRPPLRLAGLEMYERLTEVGTCLETMLVHTPDERLAQLRQGLDQSLSGVAHTYTDLRQAGDWLIGVSNLLDSEDKVVRSGAQVREELSSYVDQILQHSQENPLLHTFARKIAKTTQSYAIGLFHTYDVDELPPTNNARESEFRDLNRRLLRTTGQKGATRRLIQRSGAWEVIPRPDSFAETVTALSHVKSEVWQKERERVRTHRKRFRLHTRSVTQSRKQLQGLVEQWLRLPPTGPPE